MKRNLNVFILIFIMLFMGFSLVEVMIGDSTSTVKQVHGTSIDSLSEPSIENYQGQENLNDDSIFSKESREWLENTKRLTLSVGFPASVTPFNYYYYSSTLKGVIMDISNEFYKHTEKSFVASMITDADNSYSHIDHQLFDILVTGKQEADESAHYTQPIVEFEYGLFVPKTSNVKVTSDLKHYSIGIVNNDDNIMKYLDVIDPNLTVKMYPDYFTLYEAIETDSLGAIFVPSDLFSYYNTLYELEKVPLSDYAISYWYFRGNDSSLIKVIDEVLDVFYSEKSYNDVLSFHENALHSKFYNFDKGTYEWLRYDQPVLKVGIYNIAGFMMYDQDTEQLEGLVNHLLDELSDKFGIRFEYVYDNYPTLVEKFEAGEIDILPNFNVDIQNLMLDDYLANSKSYPLYRGDISAFSTHGAPWVTEVDTDEINWGFLNAVSGDNPNFGEYENIVSNTSVYSLINDVEENRINYIVFDPTNLTYFKDSGIEPKGRIGKYTFELMVRDNEEYIKFFDAIDERDFKTNRFYETYSNIIATSTYVEEMKILQSNLFSTQNKMLTFALFSIVGGLAACYFLFYYVQNKRTEHLKYTDPLTGLLNRMGYKLKGYLFNKLEKPYSFIILDIDYFKSVNDTYGHQTGDEAIIYLASVLKRILPPETVICRIGGDEVVICTHIVDKQKLINYLEDIMKELLLFETSDKRLLELKISVGVIICSDGKMLFEDACHKADQALYESKAHGRNQYRFYDADQK